MTSRLVAGTPQAIAWGKKMQAKKAKIRAAGLRTEAQFFGPGGEFEDEAAAKARTNPRQKGIKVYYAGVFIDGKQEQSDGFRTAREARAWIQDLKDQGFNVQIPGVYSETVRKPQATRRATRHFNPDRPHGTFRSCVRQVSRRRLPIGSDPKKICGAILNPRPEPRFTSWSMLVEYLKQEGWKPLGKKGVAAFGRTVQGLYQVLQLEARVWRVLYRMSWLSEGQSLGTFHTLDRALIAANRQANDYLFPKTPRHNPITLNGNPPKRVCTNVAGIMYNRVWEIQAEKTGDKHKGFWYHPYKAKSDVQMLALDNGDVLIHSKAGKKLWRPD